ncbi:hypothetical protein OG530_19310 [Streptomyces decoyicus]|uniref:hypothetical protein n=1 Tax=Streptomyces decoyicus TaxID=249567 RepID=UPI002E18F7E4
MDNVPGTFTGGGAAEVQPPSLGDVAKKIQRPRRTVPVYLDAEAASAIEAAEQELEQAHEYDEGTNEPDTAPDVAERLKALRDAAEASRVNFVLQAVTHRHYQRLRAEHPPTDEQTTQARERGNGNEVPAFDPDTFAPALVRAQMLAPRVTSAEEFEAFWDELSDGQMQELWTNSLAVQFEVIDPGPKSRLASEILQSFGAS